MPETRQIAKVVVNKKSIFKFKDFYDFLYQLITSNGFDILEDKFSKEDDAASFEWTCVSLADDYVKYKLWVQVKITGLSTVKVKRGGIIEPHDKADVKFTLKAKIITDWQGRWGTNPVMKFFKGLFDKYLLGSTFNDRKNDLMRKVNIIESEVKSFFDLPRFI